MKRFELAFPCRADFGSMPAVAGGRLCSDCNEIVHDLSALDEAAAHALLARTPRERVCVRYVYDARTGDVVFGARAAERGALVPEHRLLARLKSRVALAAAVAAPLLVEACGGNDGNYRDRSGDPSQQIDDPEAGTTSDPLTDESVAAASDADAGPASPQEPESEPPVELEPETTDE